MTATTAPRGGKNDNTARHTGSRAKKARFEIRMPVTLKDQLERAAETLGVSSTDIALRAIEEFSRRELEQWEVTRLNTAEAERFAAALAEPPRSNDRLRRAIKRSRELIADE